MRIAYGGVVEEIPVTADMTEREVIQAFMERFSTQRVGWRLMRDDGRELEPGPVLPQVADDEVVTVWPRVWR